MNKDGAYCWNGRILRTTRDAAYELMVAKIAILDLVESLDQAARCPNSRRKREIYEFCININGKEYRVLIGDDVVRDFDLEPCWTLIHIKPYNWN